MTARVAIAAVLVILQAFIYALGNITNRWSIATCIAYLCATLAVRLWSRPRPPGSTFDAQWVLTIGVDVIAFSALNFLQSSGINYTRCSRCRCCWPPSWGRSCWPSERPPA